jgi:hypothetical protein
MGDPREVLQTVARGVRSTVILQESLARIRTGGGQGASWNRGSQGRLPTSGTVVHEA